MKPIPVPEAALSLDRLFPGSKDLVLGDVLNDRHPALAGRVHVLRVGDAAPHWLPTLRGTSVRTGDRVVTGLVRGCDGPVVLGVLDGYRERAPTPEHTVSLELRPDETIRICAADGTHLLEICPSDAGPVLRLGEGDVCLAAQGRLRLEGAAIELATTKGDIDVSAAADVNIKGETIQLN